MVLIVSVTKMLKILLFSKLIVLPCRKKNINKQRKPNQDVFVKKIYTTEIISKESLICFENIKTRRRYDII